MNQRDWLIAVDLYLLRYVKEGNQWFELTDYLREKLVLDGNIVSYNDKNKDLIFNGISIKKYVEEKT